jgi:multidrug efflux system membrane fusion protein
MVEASATVTVKAQVTGVLEKVVFTEGQEVRAGDVLGWMDARPFEALVHQAEAALARTQAQVANAKRDLKRVEDLFAKGFMSDNDRDQAQTTLATLEASERADAAALETARINLDYCTILAPISGRTGKRLVDAGNVVSANATDLVTINQIHPVNVAFSVPEKELIYFREKTGVPDFTVEAPLPDDPLDPERGRLTFFDNAVDRTTGTLALKASFTNSSARLWPGRFVTVRMVVAVETNALVIPYRAVQNGQRGTYVFVLNVASGTVSVCNVKVARNVEEESIISEGLRAGEIVVTDGQQLLGPDASVTWTNNAASAGGEAQKTARQNPVVSAAKPEPENKASKSGRSTPEHAAP